jgi:hypothetical protein
MPPGLYAIRASATYGNVRFISPGCDRIRGEWEDRVMTPADKVSEKEKEAVEKEEDLRHEWVEEDIEAEGRKPDLQETEEDSSVL